MREEFVDADPQDAWLAAEPLPRDPFPRLEHWLRAAFAADAQPNPHAMTLASVDADGRPSARIVLCRGIDAARGALRFFSNRHSRKAEALAAHPHAALVFLWGPQGRQARVEGAVEPVDDAESDAYFATRPREAQLAAWASEQSRPVASRAALEARLREVAARFAGVAEVPRPPHWGGYHVVARAVELWHGRPGRLHDRARWTRAAPGAPWHPERLQP